MDRTNIPVPRLVDLIEQCLRSTYFQFQNDYFEQIDGTPMGSPPPLPPSSPTFSWRTWRWEPCNQLLSDPASGWDMWIIPSSSGHMERRSFISVSLWVYYVICSRVCQFSYYDTCLLLQMVTASWWQPDSKLCHVVSSWTRSSVQIMHVKPTGVDLKL